jgi:HEAT repeat protein
MQAHEPNPPDEPSKLNSDAIGYGLRQAAAAAGEGGADVDWALGVIEKLACGTTLGTAVDRDVDPGLAIVLMMAAVEVHSTSESAPHRRAACAVAREIPAVTKRGVGMMARSMLCDDEDQHILGCAMAEVLGPEADLAAYSLIGFVQDGSHPLRVVALRAIMEVLPTEATETLIECVSDPDEEIQLIAINTLWLLKEPAVGAIPCLVERLESCNRAIRMFAIMGLTAIAGAADEHVAEVVAALRTKFSDQDQLVRSAALQCACILNPDDKSLLAEAITIWQSTEIDVTDQSRSEPDSVLMFGREHLARTIFDLAPRSADAEYDDFLRKFLLIAFHPEAPQHFESLVSHPWYRKVQTSQLRRLFSKLSAEHTVSELVNDAIQEFAVKLMQNPTLGMAPDRWRELPGFIRNHAADVGKILYRRLLRESAGNVPGDAIGEIDQWLSASELSPFEMAALSEIRRRMQAFVDEGLSTAEQAVFRLRVVGGLTWEQAAAELGLSVPQARYLMDKAVDRLAENLGLSIDRALLLQTAELFCANPD